MLPYLSVLNSRDSWLSDPGGVNLLLFFPVRMSRVRGGGSMQVLLEGHIHPVVRKPRMGSASSEGSA